VALSQPQRPLIIVSGASPGCVPAVRIELPDFPTVRDNANAISRALVSGIEGIFSPNREE